MTVHVAFEHRFHSSEDVAGYIAEAKRLLTDADLLPEAMDATLAQVVNLLAAKHVQFEQVSPLGIVGVR